MATQPYKEVEWTEEIDTSGYESPAFHFDGPNAVSATVTGPCPNCQHETTETLPMYTVSGFLPAQQGSAAYQELIEKIGQRLRTGELEPITEFQADLLCNCAENHRDQPKQGSGCGVSWSLLLEVPT